MQGTAFPMPERDRLGIRGLVPPRALTLDIQVRTWEGRVNGAGDASLVTFIYCQAQRFMEEYRTPRVIPPEVAKVGGVTSEMARRWSLLQALQDRNETLFYKILFDNFEVEWVYMGLQYRPT